MAPSQVKIDIATLHGIPLYDGDAEEAHGKPQAVKDLDARIRAADGVIFACPEYNYSVTGALKNGLDWASRPPASSPMRSKPCGIIGGAAGMSGSMRAQAHLRQMLIYSDSPTLNQPEILIAKQHERFDATGQLTDASTRELLRKFAAAMVAHVLRHAA